MWNTFLPWLVVVFLASNTNKHGRYVIHVLTCSFLIIFLGTCRGEKSLTIGASFPCYRNLQFVTPRVVCRLALFPLLIGSFSLFFFFCLFFFFKQKSNLNIQLWLRPLERFLIVQVISRLQLRRLSDWLKNLAPVFQPVKSKTKTNGTLYLLFFPRIEQIQGFAGISDWFMVLFSPVVIGWRYYFHTGLSTVIWKPLQ